MMQTGLMARYAIRETMGVVVMAVSLFWAAGRIDWWPAWAAITVMLAWVIATALVILRFNPDLLAERLGPRKGAKPWDTAIMSMLGIIQLLRYVLAGLDRRFGWTVSFPLFIQIASILPCLLGYAMFVWATAANAFFSQFVHIQSERGHTVVKSGPYRYVRHPSYAGAVLYEVAVGILLASWWAVLAGGLNTALLIVRTSLEDRTLQRELPGYRDYSREVPYRFIPGIW